MLTFGKTSAVRDTHALMNAINRSQAVIEFAMDGTILDANANFLAVMGYGLDEIRGRHHSLFVSDAERDGEAYKAFWAALNRGEYQAAQYKRLAKGGRPVWIQASYNPLLDKDGRPYKVIKCATDITAQKIKSLEDAGKIAALDKAQAIIAFNLDGTIVDANDNFLAAMGYGRDEIVGQHHSMFVDPAERDSAAYKLFWERLNRGEYQAAEYKRLAKGGREIWILATYNPILDEAGRPFKVVKFATDVTAQKLRNADVGGQIAALNKAQAVIEFQLDGTIIDANQNFLDAVGYRRDEIVGRHHGMFIDPAERDSDAYRAFWDGLRRGEYQAAEYRRLGKGGREIWIQASYNPILDLNGRPFKVVKFATDTTEQVLARLKCERVSAMLESVAAGAEELASSVREISEAMVKSKDTALIAASKVATADDEAQRLSAASAAMNGIVEMINEITGQINLLALNATIESARAGEAGRGFAVVAAEVKNLAGQARGATDRIADEIQSLSGISGNVVAALSVIRQEMGHVSEYVTSTAAAIEEQTTVTSEMSASMQRAAAEAASLGRRRAA